MTVSGKAAVARAKGVGQIGNLSYWALIAIVLLGAFLRWYQLPTTPPGLFYDEAFNALQARDVVRGINRPIFFTGNNGEEPLHMYTEALMFALVGESPWAVRLASAFLGLLLVPALYFTARIFFPQRRVIALTAAFIGATLYWAVNFSRIGWETNAMPWLLTLSAGAVAAAFARRSLKCAAAAGFLMGATLYTYLAARLWFLAVFLWVVYLLLTQRDPLRARLKRGAVLAGAAILTATPLALFFLANPEAFIGRAGQVMLLDSVSINLVRTAGMFFFWGDTDPRDNLPGRPALDPILGLFLVIGLVVSLRRWKERHYALLLIWFAVMCIPSALTEFAPNYRRAIGALPAVALLCAVGVEWVWNSRFKILNSKFKIQIRNSQFRIPNSEFIRALLVVGLAFSAWSSADAYFNQWARRGELYYSFDAGLLEQSLLLAARPANEQIYYSSDYYEHFTVMWALDGRKFSPFDGRRVGVLSSPTTPANYAVVVSQEQQFTPQKYFPTAQLLSTSYDSEGKPFLQIVHIPAGATPKLRPQRRLDVRVGDFAQLVGLDLDTKTVRPGNTVELTLYWQSRENVETDYTVFVQMLGEVEMASGAKVWAQSDSQPGGGTYPTSRWSRGEIVLDRYKLKIPADAPRGNYQIQAGMYTLADGARVPLYDAHGARLKDASAMVTPLALQ